MHNLYIGTSGYTYKDWRDIFYPKGLAQKNWLSFYAERYNTVEINATFYRYFPRSVFVRWRDITPDDFVFTLKGPRPITHDKRLVDIQDELDRFLDSVQDMGKKLSVMLWQMPPSFKNETAEKDQLAHFLTLLPTTVRHVVEFRHKSWFTDDVYALLDQFKAGFVINDSSRWAQAEKVTGDLAYIRFHGPGALYASEYTTEQLAVWADRMRGYRRDHDVYVYFNNDYGGRALRNSVELRAMLTDSSG